MLKGIPPPPTVSTLPQPRLSCDFRCNARIEKSEFTSLSNVSLFHVTPMSARWGSLPGILTGERSSFLHIQEASAFSYMWAKGHTWSTTGVMIRNMGGGDDRTSSPHFCELCHHRPGNSPSVCPFVKQRQYRIRVEWGLADRRCTFPSGQAPAPCQSVDGWSST